VKITLYAAHGGLINMMKDLLEDHEVEVVSNSAYVSEEPRANNGGLVISTFPYRDLGSLSVGQKVIVYATDPFPDPGIFLEVQGRPNTVVVGDVDGLTVYPKELYPIRPQFEIPHSVKEGRYPKHIGDVNAVAIVNRKPYYRWLECTNAAFGSTSTLEEFLREVPYHVLHIPDDKDFFETVSRYKGVFYFSNNPYTLAMFELMAMNMPMVAFSGCRYGPSVMDKYLGKTFSDKYLVKNAVSSIIKNNQPTIYPLNNFEECKAKWNEVIQHAAQL
jgi:hypothetical protein